MNEFWMQLKQFCSRLFRSSKHGMETLAETLDRQAAIQRLAAQARALSRERNQLVVTIGKKVYALHRRGKVKNRDVLADCKRIDEIRDQIESLKAQIEEIRRKAAGDLGEAELEDDSFLAEEEAAEEGGAEAAPAEEGEAEAGAAEAVAEPAPEPEAAEPEPPPAESPAGETVVPLCVEPAAEPGEAEAGEQAAEEPPGG